MKLSMLVIPIFAALLGLASCAGPGRSAEPAEYEAVSLAAELVPEKDPKNLDITVLLTVSNNSGRDVTLTNVGFGGVLLAGGEARLALPPAVFSPMTLLMQPGGRYVQKIVLRPSFLREEHELSPGRYRMRLCYRRPGTLFFRPTLAREPNIVKDGVIWSLDSSEFGVVVK